MQYIEMANIIISQRIDLQLTQSEVAKRAKVSIKVVNQIESGHFGKIHLKTFIRVLNALELEIKIVNRQEVL